MLNDPDLPSSFFLFLYRFFELLQEIQVLEDESSILTESYVSMIKGNVEEAMTAMIIRDYVQENNKKRMEFLQTLKDLYEIRYPGLKIKLEFKHQYSNMLHFIEKDKIVVDLAEKAIELAGLEVKIHSIRGGTDGARLSEMGIPTPNIFSGGSLFHSRKEHIPTKALQKASEVLLHLGQLWTSI